MLCISIWVLHTDYYYQSAVHSSSGSRLYQMHVVTRVPLSIQTYDSVVKNTWHGFSLIPRQLVVRFRKTPMHCLTVVWKRWRDGALPICWPLHHPYLVCILFGMPSLHPLTFLIFFTFLYTYKRPSPVPHHRHTNDERAQGHCTYSSPWILSHKVSASQTWTNTRLIPRLLPSISVDTKEPGNMTRRTLQ